MMAVSLWVGREVEVSRAKDRESNITNADRYLALRLTSELARALLPKCSTRLRITF
jgi:hypothetical protein